MLMASSLVRFVIADPAIPAKAGIHAFHSYGTLAAGNSGDYLGRVLH